MEHAGNEHEAMRKFTWERWSAYLDGELTPEQRTQLEQALGQCPDSAGFMASQKQFNAAAKDCLGRSMVECPPGMLHRVQAALARCDEPEGARIGFPWWSVGLLTAASLMLAGSLFLVFGRAEETQPDPSIYLRDRLTPMVSRVSFDTPRADRCRYKEANEQYRQAFSDAPALPRMFEGRQCRVSDFECIDLHNRKVMCTLYDDPSGDRFALIVFRCKRVADLLPEVIDAAEMDIEGKHVLLWREGNYVRVLVSLGSSETLRHRAELLRQAA